MTIEELAELFEEGDEESWFEGEFLKFDRVTNKLSTRPDLHAFLLLTSLVPNTSDIIGGAEHDIVYLNVDVEKFLAVATKDHLIELHRCGVLYSDEHEGFYMFV